MKNAILKNFIGILMLSLLLSSVISYTMISKVLMENTKEDMQNTLKVLDNTMEYEDNISKQMNQLGSTFKGANIRFTIIDKKGNVLGDSGVEDISDLSNHGERQEVLEAMRNGTGFSRRYSETMGVTMLYVTIMSENGGYILRVATMFSGIADYLNVLLPSIVISLLVTAAIAVILAAGISKSITKPLHDIAEEMLKMKDENPEFYFEKYRFDELNVIADTTMQMSKEMNDSMKKVEAEKVIRQEFFSNASHELKTPLTSIHGYIELMQSGMVTDEHMKNDFLSRIQKETENMTSLINDILMISRLETKEVKPLITNVRIYPLLEEVLTSLAPLAEENKITIDVECKPIQIEANSQQIQELLSNLITNAIKYNKPKGSVSVTIMEEQSNIIFVVKDSGVGIPKDSVDRVFERFYRVDKGRSKKIGGTGLGLAIVKHIVEYYNGNISVNSVVNRGTEFVVTLPRIKRHDMDNII